MAEIRVEVEEVLAEGGIKMIGCFVVDRDYLIYY